MGRFSFFAILALGAALVVAALAAGCGGKSEPTRYAPPMVGARDRAVWTAARANLDTLRTALGALAAGDRENLYPEGPLDYDSLRALLPGANLPSSALEARFAEFLYQAPPTRESYTITVRTNDLAGDTLVATPSGVEPSTFPD